MTADTDRRIDKLRRIPLFKNEETYTDDFVIAVMEEALGVFLEHTRRDADLGEIIDPIIIELCKGRINKMGLEGMASTVEGGVSQSWEIEPNLKTRMSRFVLLYGQSGSSGGSGGGSDGGCTCSEDVYWIDLKGDPEESEQLVQLIESKIPVTTYKHTQSTASDVWNIQHDLGGWVDSVVFDSIGQRIEHVLTNIDDNNARIEFHSAQDGTAGLRKAW